MKNTYTITLIISLVVVAIGAFSIKTNEVFAQYYGNRILSTPGAQFATPMKTDRRFPPYVVIGNSKIFRAPLRSERIFVVPAAPSTSNGARVYSQPVNYFAPNNTRMIQGWR